MQITLLQWNVWYQEDAHKIIEFLKKVDADILCLQELTTHSSKNPHADISKLILDELTLYGACHEAQHWITDGELIRTQGNAIFSKHHLARSDSTFIQESSGDNPPFDSEGRLYVEADVAIDATVLTVGTAHMSYTHRFEQSEVRDQENNKLLAAIGSHRSSYVFAGDLNTSPDSEFIDRLPRETDLRITSPPYAQNTWTTKPFSYKGFEEKELNWRLDYAFASKDVQVTKSEILQTDVSDHLPILLTIEI